MNCARPPIVLDSNVLISAALLPQSLSAQALKLAMTKFQMVFSAATWDELRTVIARDKFRRYLSEDRPNQFLSILIQSAEFIDSLTIVTECLDPKDNKFLSLALDARSGLIVSGDAHLLVLNPFRGIDILAPGPFVKSLGIAE